MTSTAELAAQTLAMIDGPRALRIDLPWPDKLLWPNGSRGSHWAVSKAKDLHKRWADAATLEAMQAQGRFWTDADLIPVHLIIHSKKFGVLCDRDNAVSSCKVYLDAIAARLGINDRHFAAPTVEFATPRDGRFVIIIGDRA